MSMTDSQVYTTYMYSYPHKTAYRKIEPLDIKDVKNVFSASDNSLYIHIPFCGTKCGYCNLFSVVGKNEEYFNMYVDAVESHAFELKDLNIQFNSVAIGGGTPLILSEERLSRLFYIAGEILNIDLRHSFICVETSPNDTNRVKVNILKENHINRVSIGVQSFIDSELKILNRAHSVANAKTALNMLRDADFPIVNIDIIYGIPSQTTESLKYTLDCVMSYSPEEVFLYPLYLRKDSAITADIHSSKYLLYLFARDYLLARGYTQISMRRFNKQKIQITSGCGFENTISLGAGGRSYIGNIHTCLPYSNRIDKCTSIIDQYIKCENKLCMDFGYVLNEDEQKRRYIIKNLLIAHGLCLSEYRQAFSTHLLDDFESIHFFIENGYCVMKGDRVKLTPLGLSLSDYLGPMFISDDVRVKMGEWDFDGY